MRLIIILMLSISFSLLLHGCSTPGNTAQSHTRVLSPDQADDLGGSFIESSDIRTISQQLCTRLLSFPEINNSEDVVVIATEKISNSTRYLIDTNILMKRIRLELNKYSEGKFQFLANRVGQRTRTTILKERNSEDLKLALDEIAKEIAGLGIIQQSVEPVVLSLAKVSNTNLYNMNADSFASMLRSRIKEYAGEKILFTKPGSDANYDYLLTGEFFAESIKKEGVANPVNDLEWAERNQEKWRDVDKENNENVNSGVQVNIGSNIGSNNSKLGPNVYNRAIAPELWESPNVIKTFNVMLVNQNNLAVYEKTVDLEKKIKSGKERAKYILTGEISSMSKATSGQRSDYVIVELFIIDPETNDIVLDYGYETKKETTKSVLYR